MDEFEQRDLEKETNDSHRTFLSTRRKVRERKGRDLCRITCVNLPFNAQIGQFLVRRISALSASVDISP